MSNTQNTDQIMQDGGDGVFVDLPEPDAEPAPAGDGPDAEQPAAALPPARKPKTSLFALIDCTVSMDSCAILFRRSSNQHDVWTRTDEKHNPSNGLQQADFAAGLLEKHYAHVDGTIDVLKDLFEKNEGTANIYTFGGGPHHYTHAIKHRRSLADLPAKTLYEKFAPRYGSTAVMQATKAFLETVLMARATLPEDVLVAVCIATDGNDNVGAPAGTTYADLKENVRKLMTEAQEHDGIKLTFVAAGPKTVMQMAMHQMGVKHERAIHLNSHNPEAVRSCFRAVSSQVAEPVYRSAKVDFGDMGPTPLARGRSAAADPHAGNHFGGYKAAPLPMPSVPPPVPFMRQTTGTGPFAGGGGGRGCSSGGVGY